MNKLLTVMMMLSSASALANTNYERLMTEFDHSQNVTFAEVNQGDKFMLCYQYSKPDTTVRLTFGVSEQPVPRFALISTESSVNLRHSLSTELENLGPTSSLAKCHVSVAAGQLSADCYDARFDVKQKKDGYMMIRVMDRTTKDKPYAFCTEITT
jgi:hypothetical protein